MIRVYIEKDPLQYQKRVEQLNGIGAQVSMAQFWMPLMCWVITANEPEPEEMPSIHPPRPQ